MSDAFDDLFGPRRGARAFVTLEPSVAAPEEFALWDKDSSGEPFAADGLFLYDLAELEFLPAESFMVALWAGPSDEAVHHLRATGKPSDRVVLRGPGRQTVAVTGAVLKAPLKRAAHDDS